MTPLPIRAGRARVLSAVTGLALLVLALLFGPRAWRRWDAQTDAPGPEARGAPDVEPTTDEPVPDALAVNADGAVVVPQAEESRIGTDEPVLDDQRIGLLVIDAFDGRSVPEASATILEPGFQPAKPATSLAGQVRDAVDGTALEGAEVAMLAEPNDGVHGSATCDVEGRYVLPGVPLQRPVVLRVSAPGYPPAQRTLLLRDGGDPRIQDLVLEPSFTRSGTDGSYRLAVPPWNLYGTLVAREPGLVEQSFVVHSVDGPGTTRRHDRWLAPEPAGATLELRACLDHQPIARTRITARWSDTNGGGKSALVGAGELETAPGEVHLEA